MITAETSLPWNFSRDCSCEKRRKKNKRKNCMLTKWWAISANELHEKSGWCVDLVKAALFQTLFLRFFFYLSAHRSVFCFPTFALLSIGCVSYVLSKRKCLVKRNSKKRMPQKWKDFNTGRKIHQTYNFHFKVFFKSDWEILNLPSAVCITWFQNHHHRIWFSLNLLCWTVVKMAFAPTDWNIKKVISQI